LEYAVINCANVKELREIQLKVLDKVDNDVEYFELDESLILG
jgi:hypothetical protein